MAWRDWQQRGRRGRGYAQHVSLLVTLGMVFVTVTMILGACAPDPHQAAAEQGKSRLDAELRHARGDLGIPDDMLQPIVSQEQRIASGSGGFSYNYADAATNYALLYSQLTGIEQTAADTLKAQVEKDVDAFTTILSQRRSQGFGEVNAYQARLDQAISDFARASTPGDYARLDTFVRGQTAALQALWPAYQKLQDFKAALRGLRSAGIGSAMGEAEYTLDVQALSDASSAARYVKLASVIEGQIMQLLADQTEAMPYIGSTMLDAFQARIDLLHQYGESAGGLQRQHDQDARELAAAHSLADYLTLAQVINSQTRAMELPLIRGEANYDLRTLQRLIDNAQATRPLNAYEYANADVGIGNVRQEVAQARSLADYQTADADVNVLVTNLREMLDNQRDATPAWLPHQADLQLLRTYGILSGRVTIISLREQTARFYENGKLMYWSYVTTGRPELPSPPGLHYAIQKLYHTQFVSGDPKNSPLWYAPTAINYAILYANYGYFLHDAWWRYKFGPGSNLPHWDPLAFNGGSHGCVNFPEENMPFIYNWVPLGSPIILY